MIRIVEDSVPTGSNWSNSSSQWTDLVELRLGSLADRVNLRVGMGLVDRDELGPEPKTDNGHLLFCVAHFYDAPAAGPGNFRSRDGSPAG